jgi:hypothetical protein
MTFQQVIKNITAVYVMGIAPIAQVTMVIAMVAGIMVKTTLMVVNLVVTEVVVVLFNG